MKRTLAALVLLLLLLTPLIAFGEGTPLPYGLSLGMTPDAASAAFSADQTLAALTPEKLDYGNGVVEYAFDDVPIPDSNLIAQSFTVQIDKNNSANAERLSTLNYTFALTDGSIATFRAVLAMLREAYGEPDRDPMDDESANGYVEWGTLYGNWTFEDVRVTLTLNRMYNESVTLQFSSRLNYDKADLAQ